MYLVEKNSFELGGLDIFELKCIRKGLWREAIHGSFSTNYSSILTIIKKIDEVLVKHGVTINNAEQFYSDRYPNFKTDERLRPKIGMF